MLFPAHPHAGFNLACALTRLDKHTEAIAALTRYRAVVGRKAFVKRMRRDKDLDPLRKLPAFRQLVSNSAP